MDIQRLGGFRIDLGLPVDVVARDRVAFERQLGEGAGIGAIQVERRAVGE